MTAEGDDLELFPVVDPVSTALPVPQVLSLLVLLLFEVSWSVVRARIAIVYVGHGMYEGHWGKRGVVRARYEDSWVGSVGDVVYEGHWGKRGVVRASSEDSCSGWWYVGH